eukprot:26616-Chlamydomonas_euryale.AAC.1
MFVGSGDTNPPARPSCLAPRTPAASPSTYAFRIFPAPPPSPPLLLPCKVHHDCRQRRHQPRRHRARVQVAQPHLGVGVPRAAVPRRWHNWPRVGVPAACRAAGRAHTRIHRTAGRWRA